MCFILSLTHWSFLAGRAFIKAGIQAVLFISAFPAPRIVLAHSRFSKKYLLNKWMNEWTRSWSLNWHSENTWHFYNNLKRFSPANSSAGVLGKVKRSKFWLFSACIHHLYPFTPAPWAPQGLVHRPSFTFLSSEVPTPFQHPEFFLTMGRTE